MEWQMQRPWVGNELALNIPHAVYPGLDANHTYIQIPVSGHMELRVHWERLVMIY